MLKCSQRRRPQIHSNQPWFEQCYDKQKNNLEVEFTQTKPQTANIKPLKRTFVTLNWY